MDARCLIGRLPVAAGFVEAMSSADRPAGSGAAVRLLIISDTHLPTRARELPEPIWAAVHASDAVIHAGDWVSLNLLDQLEARTGRLIGVHGNNDGRELQARLPLIARATLGGVRIAVVHETGDKAGRERRADDLFPDADVVFFGHSHIPWDSVTPGGLRLLNPGSPTDRRRQPTCTYLTAIAADGVLSDVRLHHLPRR